MVAMFFQSLIIYLLISPTAGICYNYCVIDFFTVSFSFAVHKYSVLLKIMFIPYPSYSFVSFTSVGLLVSKQLAKDTDRYNFFADILREAIKRITLNEFTQDERYLVLTE